MINIEAILITILIFLAPLWLYKFIGALRDEKKSSNLEKSLDELPENDAKRIFLQEKLKKKEKELFLEEEQEKNNKSKQRKLLPIYEKVYEIKDLIPPTFDFELKFEGENLNIYIDERSLQDYLEGFEFSVNISNEERTDVEKFHVTETINKPMWFRLGVHLLKVPLTAIPKRGKKWAIIRFSKHFNWEEKTFSNYEDTIHYIIKRIVEVTDINS
jgi:hypothetical protein